jgi:D-amino-acid dehydrogenase
MRIVVVGAGIVGLSTAWTLSEAGHEVVLVERADAPAAGASGQNGAQLSYAFVAPLASPATLRGLPAMLLDRDSPLRFRPGLSVDTWRWCLQFAAACRSSRAERTTHELLKLASLSRDRFAQWRATLRDAAIDFERNGKLVLYRSASAWQAAQRQVALQAPLGPAQRLCSAAECLQLEPALGAHEAAIAGGVLTPDEEVADCAQVCVALAQALSRRPGFEAHWQTEAIGWRWQGERIAALQVRHRGQVRELQADAFVIANGVGAPGLAASLGLRLPIAPLKGYSIDLPDSALERMPRHSITDSAGKVVFAPLGDGAHRRLRVAGMAELVGHDLRIDARRIEQLLQAAGHWFGLRRRPIDLRPWAGLRPATPTGLPLIGAARGWRNLYVNAGQGALGFTLAFGSAARLAALIGGPSFQELPDDSVAQPKPSAGRLQPAADRGAGR